MQERWDSNTTFAPFRTVVGTDAMWRARQPIQAVVAFRTSRQPGSPHFASTMHSSRHPQHHLSFDIWEGKSVPPPTSSEHGPEPAYEHTQREKHKTRTNLVERGRRNRLVEPPFPSHLSPRPLCLLLAEPLPMARPAPPGEPPPPPPGWPFSHREAETGTPLPLKPL